MGHLATSLYLVSLVIGCNILIYPIFQCTQGACTNTIPSCVCPWIVQYVILACSAQPKTHGEMPALLSCAVLVKKRLVQIARNSYSSLVKNIRSVDWLIRAFFQSIDFSDWLVRVLLRFIVSTPRTNNWLGLVRPKLAVSRCIDPLGWLVRALLPWRFSCHGI